MPPASRNLAARAGAWSARHRKIAILGWLAFVIVAFVAGNAAGMKTLEDSDTGNGESRVADRAEDAAGFRDRAGEQVLVQSRDGKLRPSSPEFTAAIRDVERRLGAQPDVEAIESPLAKGNSGQVSRDGHSALVAFDIKGDPEKADEKVGPSSPRWPPRKRPIPISASSSSATRAPTRPSPSPSKTTSAARSSSRCPSPS